MSWTAWTNKSYEPLALACSRSSMHACLFPTVNTEILRRQTWRNGGIPLRGASEAVLQLHRIPRHASQSLYPRCDQGRHSLRHRGGQAQRLLADAAGRRPGTNGTLSWRRRASPSLQCMRLKTVVMELVHGRHAKELYDDQTTTDQCQTGFGALSAARSRSCMRNSGSTFA